MKHVITLFFFLLLSCLSVVGQQTSKERPSWTDGFREEYQNSYLKSFSAVGSTMEDARRQALQEVADERSRATGRQYSIRESNGVVTMSSSDELTVAAQVVDEWHEVLANGACRVDLLVQTKKNPMYTYEPVSVTDKYPFSGRVFVPGMAQLYKGSTTKGIAFIAAEVAAVGGIVAFEGLRSSYDSKINTTKDAKKRQSYIDDSNNMQNLRNAFIAGAVAIYAWNVVDGIVAKGKKHVEVGSVAMHFAPFATPDAAGLALNIQF